MKALLIIACVLSGSSFCHSQNIGAKAGLNGIANTIDIDGTKALGAYLGIAVADSISNSSLGVQVEAVFNRNALESQQDIDPYNVIEGSFLLRYLGGSANFMAGPQIVVPVAKGLGVHDMFDYRQWDIVIGLQFQLGATDAYINIAYNHGITDYYKDLPNEVKSYSRELKLGIDGFF